MIWHEIYKNLRPLSKSPCRHPETAIHELVREQEQLEIIDRVDRIPPNTNKG